MDSTKARHPTENYLLWGFKVFAGVIVVALLGIHYVVNHLLAPGGLLSYADILAYYQNPVVPVMEAVFLIFVVTHALLGIRSILLDLRLPVLVSRWIDRILIVSGAGAIVYGIWLLFRVVQAGNS